MLDPLCSSSWISEAAVVTAPFSLLSNQLLNAPLLTD
uniref:Uncharacterized protein n=1 Tax=Anguilla anguilla TaxID=7936 RepID=A0A0E9X9R4_ANGAN